jgi:hypothetical protein
MGFGYCLPGSTKPTMKLYCLPQSIAARRTVGLGGIPRSWFAGTKSPYAGMPKSENHDPEVSR